VRDLPPDPESPDAPPAQEAAPAQEATVRLGTGALTITGPEGEPLRLEAGEQVTLPGG
jgi:hypothetical protein